MILHSRKASTLNQASILRTLTGSLDEFEGWKAFDDELRPVEISANSSSEGNGKVGIKGIEEREVAIGFVGGLMAGIARNEVCEL